LSNVVVCRSVVFYWIIFLLKSIASRAKTSRHHVLFSVCSVDQHAIRHAPKALGRVAINLLGHGGSLSSKPQQRRRASLLLQTQRLISQLRTPLTLRYSTRVIHQKRRVQQQDIIISLASEIVIGQFESWNVCTWGHSLTLAHA